jgi:hypothetical protein
MLDLVRVQEVRWVKDGTEPADNYNLSMEMGMKFMARDH